MRRIERTGQFRWDYRQVRRGRHHRATLDTVFVVVLESLINDWPPEPRHRDRPLAGGQLLPGPVARNPRCLLPLQYMFLYFV